MRRAASTQPKPRHELPAAPQPLLVKELARLVTLRLPPSLAPALELALV